MLAVQLLQILYDTIEDQHVEHRLPAVEADAYRESAGFLEANINRCFISF
jgi:hypothetical protein